MKQLKLPIKSSRCRKCGKFSKVGKNKCIYCDQQLELDINSLPRRIDAIKQGN